MITLVGFKAIVSDNDVFVNSKRVVSIEDIGTTGTFEVVLDTGKIWRATGSASDFAQACCSDPEHPERYASSG